jgi:hypothetical protein
MIYKDAISKVHYDVAMEISRSYMNTILLLQNEGCQKLKTLWSNAQSTAV